MAIELPEPIARYFAADRSVDTDSAMRQFTETAVVTDEGRTYVGPAAIESWMVVSLAEYSYVVDPFEVTEQDGQTIVTAHLTGNFPGSPVDLRYRFELSDNKIAALEIGV